MMPESAAGWRPMRARRRVVSRGEKPQSSSSRLAPASTTRPLPSLPLPSEAKRTLGSFTHQGKRSARAFNQLLQLLVQQRQYFPCSLGLVRLAFLADHFDLARRFLVPDLHPVLLRRFRIGTAGFPENPPGKKALVPLARALRVLAGIDVADKEYPLGPVAVLDREGDPIQGESDPAPRAVERVVDFKRCCSVRGAD